MLDYQWTSGVISVVIGMTIFWLVKKDHLSGRHAIWWISIAIIVPVIGIFPGIIDKLGNMLGINYPPTLAVILGMGLLLIKIILQDIEQSRSETRNQRLTQKLAILESLLYQIKHEKPPGQHKLNDEQEASTTTIHSTVE